MKRQIFASIAAVALCAAARADQAETPPQPTPPVYQVPPEQAGRQIYVYDQKPLQGMPELIPGQEAQNIVDQFRTNYASQGGPRILIYVNRNLLDGGSGLKLAGKSERVETTRVSNSNDSATNQNTSATVHTVSESSYNDAGKAAPTLADRQTTRDVERLMGRPLRGGGASLVDANLATQVTHGRLLTASARETEDGQKDLKAVNSVADIVVEVLMTSRNITVPEVSGDKIYTVPDIQMTAIRLKDLKVIGQSSASDVASKVGNPGYVARNFGVEAITEATTLALMDDMSHGMQ